MKDAATSVIALSALAANTQMRECACGSRTLQQDSPAARAFFTYSVYEVYLIKTIMPGQARSLSLFLSRERLRTFFRIVLVSTPFSVLLYALNFHATFPH